MNPKPRLTSATAALLAAGALLSSPALIPAGQATAQAADPVPRVQLRKAVQLLGTMSEHAGGYRSAAFPRWTDADHDGCDTRAEVLRREAVGAVRTGEDCVVESGQWYSWYDDRQITGDPARQLDVHHLVPLKEAWESGAHAWDAATREAYANDLTAEATLTAVSASASRERGDRDPAEWLPGYQPSRCAYVADWISTKLRWGLTADFLEVVKLTEIAQGCPNTPLAVPGRWPFPAVDMPVPACPCGRPAQTYGPCRLPRPYILGISTVSTMYTVALAVGTLPQTTLEESLTV